MLVFEEPPSGWVPEEPVDDDEVPAELRGVEELVVELSPLDEVALAALIADEEARFAGEQVETMDAGRVLDAAAESQRVVNLAQVRQLVLAAHWADLHAGLEPGAWSGGVGAAGWGGDSGDRRVRPC